MVPVHRTSQSLPGQGGQDLDWTLDFGLQSGARPVSDQILQPDRSTSRSHCPRRTDVMFQTRIPGRAGKEQTREQGGSSQTSNPQIITSCPPAEIGPKNIVEPFIPLSMRLCPNEYRSLPFQGGNLAATLALGPELSSLWGFRPGFGPVGPAGVRLPGFKLDRLGCRVGR